MDCKVVSTLISKLNDQYGKTASGQHVPLTVRRGKLHDYLGMTLDYTINGKVQIDMREYVNKILEELQNLLDGWQGTSVTPAAEYLFKINDESRKLKIKGSEHFHHVVAQLFFYANEDDRIFRQEWPFLLLA